MKIAIASNGVNMDSQASSVLGRCSHLIMVDGADRDFKEIKAIPNPAVNEGGGAGIKTARIMGNEKVDVVISGSVGPNAFKVLKQLEITIYKMVPGTVRENLALLHQNKLEKLNPSAPRGRGIGNAKFRGI
jgi:predicted Fe-Mo cluster-binding NifX family protein